MLFSVTASFLLLFILQGCQEAALKQSKDTHAQLTSEEMTRLVLLDTCYLYPESKAREMALGTAAKFLTSKDEIARTIDTLFSVLPFIA